MSESDSPVSQSTENLQSENKFSFRNFHYFLTKKRLLVIVVLVIFLLLGALFMISSQKTKQSATSSATPSQADILFAKGKYLDAEKELASGLEKNPHDKTLLKNMLLAIGADGNRSGTEKAALNKAKDYIQEALAFYSNDAGILGAVGYLYEINGQYQKALDYYNKGLAIDPNNADLLFHRGHTYQFLGKETEAYKDYDKAYQLDPNNGLVVLAQARKQISAGNLQASLPYYEKVANMSSAPVDVVAEALTGESYVKQADIMTLPASRDLAKKATTIEPNFSPGLAEYGYDQWILGHAVDGYNWLNQAIDANPRIASNYWMRGLINRDMARYNAAVSDFQTCLSLLNDDNTLIGGNNKNNLKSAAEYDLARTYIQANAGNPKQIIAWFQDSFRLNQKQKNIFINDRDSAIFKNFNDNQMFLQFAQSVI